MEMLNLDLFPFEDLPLELRLMVFEYFTLKDRRDNLSFVSKSWAENLQSFTEDYQLHLYDCYLMEEIDPYSVLIKSTRKYRFLKLGKHFTSENPELVSRLLGHLGKHLHVLDISSTDEFSSLNESISLLMFAELKKLIVTKMSDLTKFDIFPESLEHIHVNQLSIMEQTKEVEHLKKIKNLRIWTSELINFKVEKDEFGESSTTIFSLNVKLKEILESLQTLDNIYLKVSTNFIGTPVVQIDAVIGMEFQEQPKTFLSFSDLPNLKSIIFLYDSLHTKSPCFDNHEVNICAKVEELKIIWDYKSCIGCFTTFIDSFPNLKKLTFLCCKCENEQFKYICSKLPHLKHLEVESYIPSQILLNELEKLKDLQSLILSHTIMPRTDFSVFCEKLPNIEFFETEGKLDVDDDSFIEILTHHWKNLRTLKLYYGFFSEKDSGNIILNCKKLRTIDFGYSINVQSSWVYHLFRDIPCLRRFEETYRKHYYNKFIAQGEKHHHHQ
uniref:CSON003556 protein n=1 Tax=Culicoides sonorensis TaxID=179676 RepID=A0A336MNR4_CULSO